MSSKQHMAHLLAKAAEMRGDEEIGMDAGRRADRAGIEEAPDAPDIGEIAAVLHDGMDAPGAPRGVDDGARIVPAVGERLFGQQMAVVGKGRQRHVAARRGHDHVEHRVGPGLVEHRIEVGADRHALEVELARPRPGPCRRRGRRARQWRCRRSAGWPRARPCSWLRSRPGRHSSSRNSSRGRRPCIAGVASSVNVFRKRLR